MTIPVATCVCVSFICATGSPGHTHFPASHQFLQLWPRAQLNIMKGQAGEESQPPATKHINSLFDYSTTGVPQCACMG